MAERVGFASYKVKGGKLIQCEVTYNDNAIKKIKYSGDFFMHPEEAIEELENTLKGINFGEVEKTILDFFATREIELFGVAPEDFVKIVHEAMGKG